MMSKIRYATCRKCHKSFGFAGRGRMPHTCASCRLSKPVATTCLICGDKLGNRKGGKKYCDSCATVAAGSQVRRSVRAHHRADRPAGIRLNRRKLPVPRLIPAVLAAGGQGVNCKTCPLHNNCKQRLTLHLPVGCERITDFDSDFVQLLSEDDWTRAEILLSVQLILHGVTIDA